MMQVGLEFGPLLGRFLVDFGSKLGGKLRPSWHQNPENEGTKTMTKKGMQKGAATNPAWGGAPYNQSIKHPKTTPWALEHSPRAQGPVADMILYVFFFYDFT